MDLSSETPRSKLADRLTEHFGTTTTVLDAQFLSGGACQENHRLDLEVGGERRRYVLRTDRGASLRGSLSRADEFAVMTLAHRAGVRTPQPVFLEADESLLGHPFYLMEFMEGRAEGRYLVKDAALKGIRPRLAGDLAANLALIHTITLENCPDERLAKAMRSTVPKKGRFREAEELRATLDELGESHPAIELGLNWLESRLSNEGEAVLVHGDFRNGNFLVSPGGLQGVLDWEFAHWGDVHEDIAWLCMRDWRFGRLNKHVGGFADRDVFYKAYEEKSGRVVDRERVLFWEVLGNVRWAVASVEQAHRHISGADRGIELAAIGRRTCEMEYELLRLIEDAG